MNGECYNIYNLTVILSHPVFANDTNTLDILNQTYSSSN